jgi:protein phosphatase
MGGEMAGEQASALAVATLTEVLTAERIEQASGEAGGDVEALLREALHEAQEAVTSLASAHPDWGRIGTTAVVALLRGDRLHVANVGDSRAYLLNGGQPQLLTRDHSIAAALAEQGQLTAEEARRHHLRNQLTAFLGMSQPLKPAYAQIQMRPGDRVVLCSDGLWDMLSDEEIARIASELPDPRAATRALIDAANHAGGRDNITVIVVTRQDEEGCGGLIPNGDTVVITGRDP